MNSKSLITSFVVYGLIAAASVVPSAFASEANVKTTKVQSIKVDTLVELDGHVEAISKSTVSAQVNAKVKNVFVDVDDKVATGSLLLELDDTELKAQLAKAEASLNVAKAQAEQARSEYARLQGLKNSRFVSDSDMTKASAAVQVSKANISLAKAQIAQVEQQLSYTKIIAPYSGVVTARHIEVGESANVGQPLLTGFALNQNRLSVHIPNSLIHWVEQTETIVADQNTSKNGNNNWLALSNLTIAPSADPVTHTVMVRANIDKAQFKQRPGSFIKVAVQTNSREVLVIPKSAIIQQGDLTAVYVKVGNTFALRQVIVSQVISSQAISQMKATENSISEDNVEVLSGLQLNDEVVANGAEFLAKQHLVSADNAKTQ